MYSKVREGGGDVDGTRGEIADAWERSIKVVEEGEGGGDQVQAA